MFNENAYALGANRSCIRDLFEYGRQRAAAVGEENVYDFSLGNPSIPSPPEVNEAICQILKDTDSLKVHGYTSAVGDLATRQAIGKNLEKRYGIPISPEYMFITCGAAPALCAVLGALSVPQGEMLAIAPYFPEYKPFTEGAGLQFRAVKADIPNFQIDLAALEEALSPHTCGLILNSPNNPSGTVYTENTLKELASLLKRKAKEYGHPIYIVSDEPYRELCYDHITAPWVPSFYENTLVCYSYSKSLSLPGERIGYLYVNPQAQDAQAIYAAAAGASRKNGHVCAPSLWQKVIARCADLGPDLQAYDRNRKALYEGLTQMGYQCARPSGAFYLFVKVPGGNGVAFSEMAKKRDVLVVPGEGFGCPGYVRLCYCVSYEKIMGSLPAFEALLKDFS